MVHGSLTAGWQAAQLDPAPVLQCCFIGWRLLLAKDLTGTALGCEDLQSRGVM